MDNEHSLAGQLLVAMPSMADPNFEHTVTFVCEHSPSGALGLTINRPMTMELGAVFDQLELERKPGNLADQRVLRGGPVQTERGFILHEPQLAKDPTWEATTEVAPSIFVTTSQDILSDMAAGTGPHRALMALGYAGWGAGQLDEEIRQNAWLTVPASAELVFDTPFEQRWRAAAISIGIDPATLSSQAGHA
jgi:putative transcriptional regulator